MTGGVWEIILTSLGKISPLGWIVSGLTLIALLGWQVAREILGSNGEQPEKVKVDWRHFLESAAHKRLSPSETELLKRILMAGDVSAAGMVFESPLIYEEALDTFIQENAGKPERDDSIYSQLRDLRVKLGFAHLDHETPLGGTRQLEAGMRVGLTGADGRTLKGKIQEVDERHWVVALETECPPALAADASVSVALLRSGDGEYSVRLKMMAVQTAARIVFLPHTRDLERRQMRNWVRTHVNIPCRALITEEPEEGETGPLPGMVLEGRLLDLSGGGTRARFATPLPRGCKLSLDFELPGASLRGVGSEVMRRVTVLTVGREDHEHHLKFLDMDTAFQETIVRYVFEKQSIDNPRANASV